MFVLVPLENVKIQSMVSPGLAAVNDTVASDLGALAAAASALSLVFASIMSLARKAISLLG